MKKMILPFLMLLAFSFAAAETYVYSNANDGFVNIRSYTSTNSEILGELVNGGDGAVLLNSSGNWYRVKYRGIIGYVHKKYVRLVDRSSVRWVYADSYDGFVNVRTTPSTDGRIIGELLNNKAGAKFLGREGNWIRVEYRGQTGYVHSKYVYIE